VRYAAFSLVIEIADSRERVDKQIPFLYVHVKVGMVIMETIKEIKKICQGSGKELIVYLSMAFGNPYEDPWSVDLVKEWVGVLVSEGISTIPLSDILGDVSPQTITEVYTVLMQEFPSTEFGIHLHCRPGDYYSKVNAAWECGVRRFDTVLGGIGGCPFAGDDLVSNLDTRDLISYLISIRQDFKLKLKEIVQRVKDLGDKGKMVTDADLLALTSAVMGEVISEEKIVDLCDMAVVTGIKVIPTASVRLVLDGKEYIAAETGVGPVDAVLKAIQKLTSNLAKIRLNEYRLEAITGGSNAVAEVVIKVEDERGHIVSARAAREDIVMASVEAMINGINKCLIKQRKLGNKK